MSDTNPPTPAGSQPATPRDDTSVAKFRARRAAAARPYQPDQVGLLLVAQAPPDADDRYFYFPDVARHDWLFRAVARAILPAADLNRDNKPSLLAQLRERGSSWST
ncbi:hypothetical protein [Mycolicibacterium aichiense]|uniref:Uncharacterized protein n=1 Tax=Mycolicibacterium aichiense TaxID=1799 RepID=A0AAD1HL22_9MYCO|nr:hypothetical protein [Mycolicibacterium aichiense]BBX06755.1 hypothetical protein MAIC_15580 [Mycolicibacterium aichiense]STZ80572.1 Uncharacterised protein [Mycolicibacterium aichiense]